MRFLVALALLTLLPAAALRAEEARLGFTAEVGYDSNAFGVGANQVDDYRIRLNPRLVVLDADGRLRWNVNYRPSYEYYIETGATRDWNHFFNGTLDWDATDRTSLNAFVSFAMVDSLSSLQQDQVVAGDVGLDTEAGARQSRRYAAGFTLSHALSRVQQASLGGRYYRTDRDVGRDVRGFSIDAAWSRSLSPRTRAGITGAFRRQELSSTDLSVSRSTDFYNVSAVLQHHFQPTLVAAVSIGPSFVKDNSVQGDVPDSFVVQAFPLLANDQGALRPVDASTCPTEGGRAFLATGCEPLDVDLTRQQVALLQSLGVSVPAEEGLGAGGRSGTTYFANISLSKSWEHVDATIFYRRTTTDQATEQLGSSSVADILGASLRWEPASRWSVRAAANWVQQERATDLTIPTIVLGELGQDVLFVPAGAGFATAVAPFAVNQDFKIIQYSAFVAVRYRLGRHATIFFTATYYQQDQDLGGQTLFSRDRWTAGVGFSYDFDPLRF